MYSTKALASFGCLVVAEIDHAKSPAPTVKLCPFSFPGIMKVPILNFGFCSLIAVMAQDPFGVMRTSPRAKAPITSV